MPGGGPGSPIGQARRSLKPPATWARAGRPRPGGAIAVRLLTSGRRRTFSCTAVRPAPRRIVPLPAPAEPVPAEDESPLAQAVGPAGPGAVRRRLVEPRGPLLLAGRAATPRSRERAASPTAIAPRDSTFAVPSTTGPPTPNYAQPTDGRSAASSASVPAIRAGRVENQPPPADRASQRSRPPNGSQTASGLPSHVGQRLDDADREIRASFDRQGRATKQRPLPWSPPILRRKTVFFCLSFHRKSMQAWILFLVSIDRGTPCRIDQFRPWLSDMSRLGRLPAGSLCAPGCGARRCRRTEACESRFHRPKPYTGASGSMNPRFRIRLGTWSRNQIRKDSRQRRMSDAPFDTQDQRFAETGASKNAAIICLSIETSGVSRQRQALPEADSRSSQRTSLIARFSRRASRQN